MPKGFTSVSLTRDDIERRSPISEEHKKGNSLELTSSPTRFKELLQVLENHVQEEKAKNRPTLEIAKSLDDESDEGNSVNQHISPIEVKGASPSEKRFDFKEVNSKVSSPGMERAEVNITMEKKDNIETPLIQEEEKMHKSSPLPKTQQPIVENDRSEFTIQKHFSLDVSQLEHILNPEKQNLLASPEVKSDTSKQMLRQKSLSKSDYDVEKHVGYRARFKATEMTLVLNFCKDI